MNRVNYRESESMCDIVGATAVDDRIIIEFNDGKGIVINSNNKIIAELDHLNERHYVTKYLINNRYYGLREIVERLNLLPVTTVRDASVLNNTYVLSYPHVRYVIRPCKPPRWYNRGNCTKGVISDWGVIDEIRDVLTTCSLTDVMWTKMKHGNYRGFFKLNDESYELLVYRK